MITRVTYENLKGRTAAHDLGKLTLITGKNRKGKTTITTALTLAALGYWPRLGKTNKATHRLASAATMKVSATFDTPAPGSAPGSAGPSSITRTWKQSGKSVNATETGEAPDIGALLNPDVFIGAKPADKIAMLAGLSKGDDSKEYAGLLEAIAAAGGKVPAGENAFVIAEAMADGLEEKAREAKRDVATWTKTVGGIGELINSAGVPKRERNGAQAALEAAIRTHADARSALSALESRSEAAADARDALAALGDVPAGVADPTAMRDAEAAMIAANEAINQATARESFARGELQRIRGRYPGYERAAAQKEHAETLAAGDPTAAYGEAIATRDELQKLNAASVAALAEKTRIVEDARAKLESLEKMTACPTCHACAEGWKAGVEKTLREVIETGAPEIGRLADEGAHLSRSIVATSERVNTLGAQAQRWNRLQRLQDVLDNFDEADKGEAALAKFSAEVDALRGPAETAAAKFREESEKFDEAFDGESVRKRAEELRRIIAAAPSDADVNTAAGACAAAESAETRAREALAEERQNNLESAEAAQREKDLAEATEKLQKAEADVEKHTAAAKELRAKMRDAMKSLFGPVLKFAAPLSRAVMDNELSLNADGEIGVQLPGSFVPFEILSGEEQIIATIAIQAGLSAAVGGVVMLDEFSRVDADDKPKLANALIDLVTSGALSQVIIIDHDAKFAEAAAGNGWTVLRP